MAGTVYAFGDYELDTERFELRRRGAACHLEPQVLDLLLHLVKNRDRLVTKQELHDAIWSGRVVSDSALSTRINAARQAIGDGGSKAGYIRTVFRRGFRFVGPVEERELGGEGEQRGSDARGAGHAILCGSFACYSQAWSPAFEGRIIRGSLVIDPPSALSPAMRVAYMESLPHRAAPLRHRGEVALSDRIMYLDLVDAAADSRVQLALVCPNPPASALLGVMCGKVFHHPNSELAVARILAVRVPAGAPDVLAASNRYLDSADSLSRDLRGLGLGLAPSAPLDSLLRDFLNGPSATGLLRVTVAENHTVNVAIDKALAQAAGSALAPVIGLAPPIQPVVPIATGRRRRSRPR
jgi:DNA-binding winged helix-turn-helix (wHTH) protein